MIINLNFVPLQSKPVPEWCAYCGLAVRQTGVSPLETIIITMEIEGIIVFDLPLQEGISKAGNPWKKKEWVLETGSGTPYPKKVKFTVFGDRRVNELQFEVGKAYKVQVDLESRDFNGRWYTDVNAYAATKIEGGMNEMGGMQNPADSMGQQPQQFDQQSGSSLTPFPSDDNGTDDLPF